MQKHIMGLQTMNKNAKLVHDIMEAKEKAEKPKKHVASKWARDMTREIGKAQRDGRPVPGAVLNQLDKRGFLNKAIPRGMQGDINKELGR